MERKIHVQVTLHARQRAQERTALKKSATESLARRALEKGLTLDNVKNPKLRQYLQHVIDMEKGKADRVAIHAGQVWIYRLPLLLTVYPVPASVVKLVVKEKKTPTVASGG
jgi:hypothetical protein